ncbi:MAG: serine/threonine protein kinase [Anaerolineae bacterium]|nr:serine/threonine protein kinase [Anaerolineae bacterium]
MSNLQPGQMVGPYRIINQIGKGGMATVYKAYQAAMDRHVALKVLPVHLAQTAEFTGRFHQEARIIANLEHPHILPVFDYGETDGISYLVMRYLEAGTLKEKLEAEPLPLTEIDRLFTQLAGALGYAHAQGVIHRDLKPSNVLVDKQDNVFLTDFGIAKLLEGDAKFTQTDAIIGTPAYISPEQGQGQPATRRSDIYSLGIILYEMVTGRVPFTAETPMAVIFKHVSDPLPLPTAVKPDLSPQIETVILKALSKNPEDRFASAAEFVAAWKQALSGQGDTSGQTTTRRSDIPPTQKSQPPVVATAVEEMPPKPRSSNRGAKTVLIGCVLLIACLLLTGIVGSIYVVNWGQRTVANLQETAVPLLAEGTAVMELLATIPAETLSGDGNTGPVSQTNDLENLAGQRFDIAIGDAVSRDTPDTGAGFIENPGALDIYTFTATPGQLVYFQVQEVPTAAELMRWRLVDEFGSEIFNTCLQCSDPGVQTLDRGGLYTIVVGDERDAGSGRYRFKLWDVPAADEFTIEIGAEVANGVPGNGAGFIETLGVKDQYTFTSAPGQTVYFQVTQPPQSSDLLRWRVVDAVGREIFNTCLQCSDPGVKTLDQGGVYTIVVGNDSGPATGTYGFKIWDVPPTDQFTLNIGDTVSRDTPGPGAGIIESPGAKDEYRFTATAGQDVYFQVVQAPQSGELIRWRVVDQVGREIFNTCLQCSNPGVKTLDQGGNYTIIVGNDTGPGVGAYEIRIYQP